MQLKPEERGEKLKYLRYPIALFLVTLYAGLPGMADAHEPLFGLGPHTVGKYSWALESEFERGEHGWFTVMS